MTEDAHSSRIAQLAAEDEDLRSLLAEGWVRYRSSPALQELSWEAHASCDRIGKTFYADPEEARRLFHELVPGAATDVDFRPPLSIDYGDRLRIGARTFVNADLMVIGGGLVTIGADCLLGPRCSIYTPNHAEDPRRRLEGWELPEAVTIQDRVWTGGSVTILPGVTIGHDSIIGAGSVVTRDIPPKVIAVGNPCRPVRPLDEADSLAAWAAGSKESPAEEASP